MNQTTHAWIALRAVGLLQADPQTKALGNLLAQHACAAAFGAWLPDVADKSGGGATENHVLKLAPLASGLPRFVIDRESLCGMLGKDRAVSGYLTKNTSLTPQWWKQAYKADPPPGKHLANRAMAMSIMLVDLLTLSGKSLTSLFPKQPKKALRLTPDEETRPEQVALYFFMLSHFLADACMPCHCDDRILSSYQKGALHHPWEVKLEGDLGTAFAQALSLAGNGDSNALMKAAGSAPTAYSLQWPAAIPTLKNCDVWTETVALCRASFALDCIIAPIAQYGFGSNQTPSLDELTKQSAPTVQDISKVVLQDAVLNVAIVWKHIWLTV